MEPILAARLVDKELNVIETGLFFAILPCFWIPSCMLVNYIPKQIEKRALIIFTSFIVSPALLCMGPSIIPDFSDSLIVMALGQAMFGVAYAFILVPSLPEMLESATKCFPLQEQEVNYLCSGIFSALLGLSQVIGPIVGASSDEAIGFRHTMALLAALNFVYTSAYLIFGSGITSFYETYKNFK